ncbi:GSCOCG00002922001-RA-CDS [Cotesia congregata]|nr:GSCOCG00002922001-RA-CDS [Cotesia congregata]
MAKVTIIILMAVLSLALGAAIKKKEIDFKKDKRGLIDLGYGYALTPDYIYSQKEYVVPLPSSHHSVAIEKHYKVPLQPQVSVYNPYHLGGVKSVPVAPTFHQIPLAVQVPDATFHQPYAQHYSYGIAQPIIID